MIQNVKKINYTPKVVKKTDGKTLENNSDRRPYEYKCEDVIIGENNRGYTKEEVNEAVKETNEIIFGDNKHFEFKVHEKTGQILVKLVDNETDEVIKEIPPEKILDLVSNIWELVGILVDKRG